MFCKIIFVFELFYTIKFLIKYPSLLYSNGYNGNLTSAQNGSVGGEMVRKMIKRQEETMAGK